MNEDPLNKALLEATLSVLLGSNTVPQQYVDGMGNPTIGIGTIQSAFITRIQSKAYSGEFDKLIAQAMEKVSPEVIAKEIEKIFAKQLVDGLGVTSSYGSQPKPNWLAVRAKEIAVEACTSALKDDPELLDTLRARIGAEVDRNRVGITVNLSDPENS